jgi:molybdopterin synthase sulfur carrier subunit
LRSNSLKGILTDIKSSKKLYKEILLMSDEEKAAVILRLPSTLSAYSGGKSQIQLRADTMEQLLAALEQLHPQLWERLCTQEGHVRDHVKIFVNNEMISGPNGLKTPLKAGQEVIVLPSVFGN